MCVRERDGGGGGGVDLANRKQWRSYWQLLDAHLPHRPTKAVAGVSVAVYLRNNNSSSAVAKQHA